MTVEIDQLLIPKRSRIEFEGRVFVTNADIIVDGSVKGMQAKKNYPNYYFELTEVKK